MKSSIFYFIPIILLALCSSLVQADEERKSPWLVLPLVSTNPKLDTAAGAMVAYIKKFDEESRTSMFGLQSKYSKSDSVTGGMFARTSYGKDHHRIVGGLVLGKINNDYQDFLGTGKEIHTQDDLRAGIGRYLYRVKGNVFVGIQGAYTNYEVAGRSSLDDELIDNIGLVGFKSGGVGASILHDSRDNDFKPSKGWFLNANNIAYREKIAGDLNFDIYRLDFRYFIPHSKHVLAIRQRNQWASDNTPSGAFSPVQLRGYTPGEYLSQYMSSIEVEERFTLHEKWTATAFTGVAQLYGAGSKSLSNQYFPAVGAGIQYVIKPKEGLVANFEVAKGRSDDQALYLKVGYSF